MPPEQQLHTTTSARTSPLLHLPDATRSEQSHATGAAAPDHDQRKNQTAPTPARRDAKRAKPCRRSSGSRPRPAQGSARSYACPTRCEASKAMPPEQRLHTTTTARIRPLLRRPNAMRSEQSHTAGAATPDHDQRKNQTAPTPAERDAKRAKPCIRSNNSAPRPARGSGRSYADRTRCEASKAMQPKPQPPLVKGARRQARGCGGQRARGPPFCTASAVQNCGAFPAQQAGKAAEPACKPGSVVDSHSSRRHVTVTLEQPTRTRRGPRH